MDIVCAGSPCQGLSTAGLRKGLEDDRSGLFHIAVETFHRLRNRDGKPRFLIWENVCGSFTTSKGLDFRAVLEEIGQTEIPMPTGGDGHPAEWQNCLSAKLLGKSWIANTSEYHRGDVECGLSQILMKAEDVPQKYYLSQKACLGILRRAKERGKQLPMELKQALIMQANLPA